MRDTRLCMGMPVTVEIVGGGRSAIDRVFLYFVHIDEKFSTYKPASEISDINYHGLPREKWSDEMKEIFELAEHTKKETKGFFDIKTKGGTYDPSGIVKGYAIWNAGKIVKGMGFRDFFIDAGGDIEVSGKNKEGKLWNIGIRDPFDRESKKIVKTIYAPEAGLGIATSGTYLRGQHIYNPHRPEEKITDIVSLTVVGPNIYDADRFATGAFAMGKEGIRFIQGLPGFEGYMIDRNRVGTMTSEFEKYTMEKKV